jgi:hypothetical protein
MMPPVSLEVTPWTPARNPILIARNRTGWYRITHSLRAIIETTNAAILEAATSEEKQPSRNPEVWRDASQNNCSPRIWPYSCASPAFQRVVRFNHSVYGNRWPELLAIAPAPSMLQRTTRDPFHFVMIHRARPQRRHSEYCRWVRHEATLAVARALRALYPTVIVLKLFWYWTISKRGPVIGCSSRTNRFHVIIAHSIEAGIVAKVAKPWLSYYKRTSRSLRKRAGVRTACPAMNQVAQSLTKNA